ncbi:MAG: DUF554 domain-containing protein [Ruminococcaceae bacterium]|nr:DUF554 domain-containing protein [Oscillospiraceae bacterium]
MLGVLVNFAAVAVGSLLGLLFKRGIPERFTTAIMTAMGLCVLYIGIDGTLEGSKTVVLIIAMALGTALGTLLNIDGRLQRLGEFLENKFKRGESKSNIAEGFVTGSLLFCVGAMAIVGSLESGISGDHSIIYTKSIIDLISACMLTGTLGIGVMFSAVSVFLYQGALVLLAGVLQPYLTDAALIAEISCAGSLMIMCLGFNMLGIKKIKVADMLPAIIFVPIICFLARYLPI